jgi:hypothetical protein
MMGSWTFLNGMMLCLLAASEHTQDSTESTCDQASQSAKVAGKTRRWLEDAELLAACRVTSTIPRRLRLQLHAVPVLQ